MAIATFKLFKCIGEDLGEERYLSTDYMPFLSIDSGNASISDYPIAVPTDSASEPGLSYEAWLLFELNSPPDNSISNIRVYGSVLEPSGFVMKWGTANSSADVTPVDVESSVADTIAHENYNGPNDSMVLNLATTDNKVVMSIPGDRTIFMVAQLHLDSTAGSGPIGGTVISLIYDEN